MVINVGWASQGRWDLRPGRDPPDPRRRGQGVPLKVILETCYLSNDQIARASQAATPRPARRSSKTSTGFGTAGATGRPRPPHEEEYQPPA